MSKLHLKTGDPKPAFDPKKKFRIYSAIYCPFAQRVRLVLSAKGIGDHDIANVRLGGENPEWYNEINPLGKVPAIEFANGETLYESLIVSDLLDELYPENPLNPPDPKAKAREKLFIDIFGNTYIPSFYKYGREKTEKNKEALLANLAKCDKHLENGKLSFFGGDQPSMIDYMLWPFFERLPMLYDLSAEIHPNLSNWCNKMHCIPAVKKESLPADVYKRFYDGYFKGHAEYDFS